MIKKLLPIVNLLFPNQNQNTLRMLTTKSFGNSAKWLCFVLFFMVSFANSQTTSTATGGAWNNGATWVGGVVPANGATVIIATTGANTVDITADVSQTVGGSVTINNGARLTTSGGTITFGALTINNGGFFTCSRVLNVTGSTNITGTLTFGGTDPKIFTGNVTINTGGTWNNSGNAAITFRGGVSNNGTFTSGSGSHTFDTNNQALSGTLIIPSATITGVALTNNGNFYNTVSLSGTGSIINALPAATTLVIQGTCSVASVDNRATANIENSGAISSPTFTNTGTLNRNGTGTIATITNNASGIVNLSGSGIITSFNNATSTSLLNITTTSVPITTLTATAVGNTVNYTAATAQTVKATTYSNLTLSGSDSKTTTSVTVNNILSMEGAATASVAPTYGGLATLRYNTSTGRIAGAEWVTPFAGAGGVIIANSGAITVNAAKEFSFGVPLTINGGATLITNSNGLVFQGDFINNGAFTGGSSPITITGTATQSIAGFTTSGAVSMTKTTGGAATFTGNVNGGSLSINGSGGIIGLGTGLTHTFTGSWDRSSGTLNGGSSTLRIGGNVNGTGSTFTAETSTVEFNGTVPQSLGSAALTYNNLILSGSGTKSFSAITTASNTWSISSGVVANLGSITTHAAKTLLLNGVAPALPGSSGSTSSSATNQTDIYFTSTATGRINIASVIDNNFASYNNSTGDLGGGIVGENTGPLILTAPNGTVFINAKFASYGTPGGVYPNFTIGGCHSPVSRSVTTGLLGGTTATIPASGAFNTAFGDYCNGTIKTYSVVATYALPICSGTNPGLIDGSTPTGGIGTYTYLWQQSNSLGGTYTTVSGTNNAEDYTPSGTLTATTYYKRIVTSGIYTDETIVIVPVITAPASTAPTISSLCSGSTLSVPESTIAGTYVEWFAGSCASTVVGTGTTYNPTAPGNYFARYTNRCGSSNCGTINIATTPTNPVVITPVNPGSICITGTAQTASLSYTATGTPATYSIIWAPGGFLINIANRNLPSATSGNITLDVPSNVPPGTYTGTITVRTSGGCMSASKTFALTIGKIAGAASSTQTLCVNTVLTAITHSTLNANGIGTPLGLPAGVTASWASNAITISGTPTASGTFNYSIPLTGSCAGSANATGTITVNVSPAPTATVTVQPSCTVATGTITVSSPVAGTTYSIDGSTYTNTTGTFTGVAPGPYNVTARSAFGCFSEATPVTVNAPAVKTWTGSSDTNWNVAGNWTPTGVPSSTDCVFIPNVVNKPVISGTNGNFFANIITVNAGGSLIVNSTNTLTVTGAVNVNTGGTLTFENNASLFQDPTTTVNINTGNIIYKRDSAPLKNFDYSYWSSPVAPQKLYDVSPNTLLDKFMSFTGTDWKVETPMTTDMISGIGYIIRVPKPNFWPIPTAPSYVHSVEFIGKPNNGDIPGQSVTAGNFYLIGNPYPSAIRAADFLAGNTILDGTVHFWTHNTAIQQTGSKYIYASDDYASHNGTGGVAALSGTTPPTGNIAAGQSFFANAVTSGTIQFKNNMRIAGNNDQFFKPGKTDKTSEIEKNRLWLNMTNSEGAFKQTLIGYVTGATNDIDNAFDGESFDGNSFIDFYSLNNTKKLVIQGRALPFEEADMVPMGYRSTIEGDFTIAIDNADGLLATHKVYLEDKNTNTVHELTANDYTFTTAEGTFNDRFVVKYTNKTLGTGDFETVNDGIEVVVNNKVITISSEKENIDKVHVYDISGKLLYQKDKISNTSLIVDKLKSAQQVLLIKVILENGNSITRKSIFQ